MVWGCLTLPTFPFRSNQIFCYRDKSNELQNDTKRHGGIVFTHCHTVFVGLVLCFSRAVKQKDSHRWDVVKCGLSLSEIPDKKCDNLWWKWTTKIPVLEHIISPAQEKGLTVTAYNGPQRSTARTLQYEHYESTGNGGEGHDGISALLSKSQKAETLKQRTISVKCVQIYQGFSWDGQWVQKVFRSLFKCWY